jgi:hypothetical protein
MEWNECKHHPLCGLYHDTTAAPCPLSNSLNGQSTPIVAKLIEGDGQLIGDGELQGNSCTIEYQVVFNKCEKTIKGMWGDLKVLLKLKWVIFLIKDKD